MKLKVANSSTNKNIIGVESAIWQALRLMLKNKTNFLLVSENETIIGTITRDKLESASHFNNGEMQTLSELILKTPLLIDCETTINTAIQQLKIRNTDHFIVTRNSNEVIEIVSVLDLLALHQCNSDHKLADLHLLKASPA